MHIVLVTTSFPETQSGSEAAGAFVAEFAQHLSEHAKVTVVAATSGPASVQAEGACTVRRFRVKRWPLSLLRPHHPADWWPIYVAIREGRRAVDEVVRRERPDYVFALWALPSGYWARKMLRRHGTPYAVWALGSDIWSLGRIPVLRSILRRVLKSADRCFADGLELGKAVSGISGMPCDFMPSARVLPGSSSRELASGAPYRLAYLGRWHPNKGVDIFLESLGLLGDDDWDKVEAVRVQGGGPLEGQVHRLVEELQASGRPVTVGGYLDQDGATELFDWTDYLALPSRIESIPVIFSDAAQRGRPLIATPVGDLPGLYAKREFGILAAEAAPAAYRDALRQALETPPATFQAGLEEFAREFDIRVVAREFAAHVGTIAS